MSSTHLPKLRFHKGSGVYWAAIGGRDCWYTRDVDESSRRHDLLVAEWLAFGRRWPAPAATISITELAVRYFDHAKAYYVKNGKPTKEVANIRLALRGLRRLYGPEAAAQFGPKKLKAVRESWIEAGHSRKHINKQIGRLKRAFDWAVAEELVPGEVRHALAAVKGLRMGRSEAVEREPVRPVPIEDVEKTVPQMPPVVAAMVRVQSLLGCRPEEVTMIRMVDIDRSDSIWIYRPQSHKNEHHGHDQTYPVGPRCQKILCEFFKADPNAYLFSPRSSEEQRATRRRAGRKTPMTPSQRARRSKARPKRKPKERYSTDSYRRAVVRACEKAGVDSWSPLRLRHSRATEVRREFGLEAAQVSLGHSKADVTQVYAERDLELAKKVAREIG